MITYCTRADVEALWTPAAVLTAADDDENGTLAEAEELLIEAAIERGANQINAVLEQRYTLTTLANNAWCRDANSIFAAYFLAARKSETLPVGLSALFSWYRTTLEEIARRRAKVPAAAEAPGDLPAVTNFNAA